MIYLDNAATTRVFEVAADAAVQAMREQYFNPNATYKSSVRTREYMESARREIAEAVGAQESELFFVSCATEANNWVFSCGIKNRKGNIVISGGEHSSVYEPAMQLKSRGTDVRISKLNCDGTVDEESFLSLIDDNTALASVIHVSNETGAVNDVKRLAAEIRKKSPKTMIHSDGVQGFLKTETALDDLGVDFYSASAHKIGAPKGIGLLYVKRGIHIAPFIFGGGQERGLRSGTQNTPYIAAFAAAVREFKKLEKSFDVNALRKELCGYFTANGGKIIGDEHNSGYIICLCLPGVKAEIVQNIAHDSGVIIGKGSACSGSKRGNRVLEAIGLSSKDVECCVRISLFPNINRIDALNAAQIIIESANKIK